MRVLMLLFNKVGKGTYWRALYLARSLGRLGYDVSLLATSRTRRFRFEHRADVQAGVELIEAPDLLWGPLRSGWDVWNTLARIGWSAGRRFDLVHAFESRPTVILPALYWQRCRKTPLVLDWCDWFGRGGSVEERPSSLVRLVLRPVETFFEERFRVLANGTTVINSVLRRRAVELGVASSSILDLPNGSNVDELYPVPKDQARRALGWPQDALIVGYVGAIFERDAILMAQAFDRVREAEPKARLLVVGYCNVDVDRLVAVPEAVWMTGHVRYEQINQYLAACDVCWLPLRDSGANRGRFPLKINDYMAVGRPVVATAVGDVADLVRRGGFGLLASDQPEDLAQQTLSLLRDPFLRASMGQKARQLAESEFTWDQIAAKLARFYGQVVQRERL